MKNIGNLIKDLRTQNNMTQLELANFLNVTDKAVSKWERNICLPDILVLNKICKHFKLDISSVLSISEETKFSTGENMKSTKYFICKKCSSITMTTGNTKISCCDNVLDETVAIKTTDENRLIITEIDGQRHITSDHPMTKENYIWFIAFVKGGEMSFFKQYPQWEINLYLPKFGHGRLLWYAPDIGLNYMDI